MIEIRNRIMLEDSFLHALWQDIGVAEWWIQLSVGLGLSVIGTILINLVAKGPLLKLISRSKNTLDDRLFEHFRPLINVGTLLVGTWLTFDWVFENGTFPQLAFGGGSVILLLWISAKCLSNIVVDFIPIFFSHWDDDTEIDLIGIQNGAIAVSNVVIWSAAIMMSLSHFNVDVTAVIASATVLSLVIGMALQESASGLVAGALMAFDKPFKRGDKVIVAGTKGRITDIGLLSTSIKTGEERMVIIPNKQLATEIIENYAQGNTENPEQMNLRHRLQVGKQSDPAIVKQIIMEILDDCEYTMKHDKTEILLYDILDSGLMFRIDCWISDYNEERRARDWILCEIIKRFNASNIELPYPHLEISKD